jgi:ankyrin repeat protein
MRHSRIIRFLTVLLLLAVGFWSMPAEASVPKRGPMPGSPEAEYLQAIKAGDLKKVRQFLARGLGPNTIIYQGKTALICAAGAGHLPVVQALLTPAAKIDAKDQEGETALTAAAAGGHLPVVEVLLAKGAQVHHQDQQRYTPLMWAAFKGWPKAPTSRCGTGTAPPP